MNKTLLTFLALLYTFQIYGQINYTANDTLVPYDDVFRFGMNPGAYRGWTDDQLADISAGNAGSGIEGIGVNAFRPTLPGHFVEFWGYDIRINEFRHYDQLGMKDNVVFVGYPSPEHRELKSHCLGVRSETFANLYKPIWDDGENGTPVNDENYFALYLFKTVSLYKNYVRFWEIWNEPDFSFNIHSVTPSGTEGSWWDENPDPCDHALRAPVTHYVRMLRIAYEVIKSIDPKAYVTTGGLGYPSYLDAVLRNTDNPDGGKMTPDFPSFGGAYFDVVSFHSYPHIDGTMRRWSNEEGGFVYNRNSDAAVDGLINLKHEFQSVTKKYGYDGFIYPEKLWIVTESNIPRKRFQDYIGSKEAQRNFLMKAVVACMQNDILQLHPYSLADVGAYINPKNEFETMGFFQDLNNVAFGKQLVTEAGLAYRTASEMLYGKTFDLEQTTNLNLPQNVKGGAFRDSGGHFTYVLWAETTGDNSENVSAMYSFPEHLGISHLETRIWNAASSERNGLIAAKNIQLTGSPVFFSAIGEGADIRYSLLGDCFPNPFSETLIVEAIVKGKGNLSIDIYDARGILIQQLKAPSETTEGIYLFDFQVKNLVSGIYFLKLALDQRQIFKKIVKVEGF